MAIHPIHDLTELRELPIAGIADGDVIYVAHHSMSIDQGGGLFTWDPRFVGTTDDTPESDGIRLTRFDDGGTFIKPATLEGAVPGRWRRVEAMENPSVMRARWFGAVAYPRGIADAKSGYDSHRAIQAAADALPIVTFNCPRTSSGRYIRVGMVELPTGDLFLGDTLRITCRCTIRGQGKGFTHVFAKDSAFPLEKGEKWMIAFEKPDVVNANNCFNTCCEDLSLYGLSENNNEGCSGLWIFGAQGSHVKNVDILRTGVRGILCDGIPMIGECWIADCVRGPLVEFHGMGGPGQQFGNLSIEHCNPQGTHIDPDNGLPYAALKIMDTLMCRFQQLQFEASPVDICIVNGRGITIDRLLANVGPTTNSYGVRITGDSYGNSIPDWYYLGGVPHTHPYQDHSLIAKALRQADLPAVAGSPISPKFQVSAKTLQAGVAVETSVVLKAQSLGWFVHSDAALKETSVCTIEISGSPWEWSGAFVGGAALYGMKATDSSKLLNPSSESGGILARITVARTSEDGASGRISKAMVTGKGTRLIVMPEGESVFGKSPPPEVRFAVSPDGGDPVSGRSSVFIRSTNRADAPASYSLHIEVL